ncbi:hypothetical protein RFI_29237 [Reticulomyxa filosa]|uniref:PUM-HD domain-containing protein n=1 Tax=Reticulomyxa filosa TaxID=46433 RepID=X6M3V6_RETFI|nr:hypothetical protein RFI_29237 [Reticulomyxa filosa]|eukprot:ETO08152.1 hypothetical protein RFI_29237 [Reticulomyxa filosa]
MYYMPNEPQSMNSTSGSRFVQEKLCETKYFEMFFDELKEQVAELMMDNFGHYAVEALFNHCNDEERTILMANLRDDMDTVACHKQGSFSIQAMMDTFTYPETKFIYKAIIQYSLELATDHYGLRVLKDVVEQSQTQVPSQELLAVFMSIVKHTNPLVENQYGNYIVQHLLDVAPREVTDIIKEKMHGKFVRYSKQKFSSNVVEKCLRHSDLEMKAGVANKDWRRIIIKELLNKVGDLISDKYANYCLQTALQTASSDPLLLSEFYQTTKPHLENLVSISTYTYTHIYIFLSFSIHFCVYVCTLYSCNVRCMFILFDLFFFFFLDMVREKM